MPNSIVDSIMSLVTPQITGALASKFGAPQAAVQTGLGTGVASIIGALANKASNPDSMSQIQQLVKSAGDQNFAGNVSSMVSGSASGPAGETVSKFLSMLFGGQLSSVESAIANHAGLSGAAGGGILSMAAPLVLGFFGQRMRDGSMTVSSLGDLLKSEAPRVQGLLPAGLLSSLPRPSMPSVPHVPAATPDSGGGTGKALMWLVGIAAVGVIGWLLASHGCNANETAQKVQDTASQATSAVSSATSAVTSALGEFFKRKLPDGTELNIPKLGIENKLIDFIEDSSKPIDATTWFDFDRLLFDTGKATLQPSSQEQLSNIAAILKAYPRVSVKIGGYTDNTGNKEANLKLSDERAHNVMAELVKLGIDPARMKAEGYGEDHPVADNATEEGRAKNRRISLRVTEK